MSSNKTPLQRFHEKYSIDANGCWIWSAGRTLEGYGKLKVFGKTVLAHRWYYKLNNSIPDELTLDHLCRVRCCVNPSHLEPVTQQINTLRGVGPSAENAIKTHCIRGHEFTPENTRIANNKRHCRKCYSIRTMESYYRKKQQDG